MNWQDEYILKILLQYGPCDIHELYNYSQEYDLLYSTIEDCIKVLKYHKMIIEEKKLYMPISKELD